VQKIVTRNNRIFVFDISKPHADPDSGETVPGSWISIDTLPANFYADFLLVAEYGAQKRLWIIDRDAGPCLYEQGDVDETGDAVGGVHLPFNLPVNLSAANYESVPIPGLLVNRTISMGSFVRTIKAGAARLWVQPDDAGTLTTRVMAPGSDVYEVVKSFDGTGYSDLPVRNRCGRRGLDVQQEIRTLQGRPVVRSFTVETTASGRVKEDDYVPNSKRYHVY
jgi:hypothetical protein